jgi:hypothetical protein
MTVPVTRGDENGCRLRTFSKEPEGLATRWEVIVSVHLAEKLSLETIRLFARQEITHTWCIIANPPAMRHTAAQMAP